MTCRVVVPEGSTWLQNFHAASLLLGQPVCRWVMATGWAKAEVEEIWMLPYALAVAEGVEAVTEMQTKPMEMA